MMFLEAKRGVQTLFGMLLDRSARDFVRVLGGDALRLALGFLSSILIARGLGPVGYGSYAVIAATVAILMTFSDFGLTPSAVRFLAREPSTREQRRVMATYMSLKGVWASVTLLVALALAAWFARHALARPALAGLLRLGLLLLLSSSLSALAMTLFQGLRRFREYSVLQPLNPGVTLVAIALLAWFGRLSVATVILVSVVAPIVPFVVGVRLAGRRNLPLPVRADFRTPLRTRQMIRFSKWLWISSLFATVASLLDLLLLNRYGLPENVGVYALALSLTHKVALVNGSLITVLMPNVSAFQTRQEFEIYITRALRRILPAATGLLLVGLLGARPLIVAIYGLAYAGAVPLFDILLLEVVIQLAATPFVLLAYPLQLPKILAGSEALKTIVLGVLGLFLVGRFGPTGIAAAKLASGVAGTVLAVMLVFGRLRALRVREDEGSSPEGTP